MGLVELLILILLIGWLLGWGIAGVGSLIHLLLLVCVVLFLWRLLSGGYRGGPRV